MARFRDIVDGLSRRTSRNCTELAKDTEEMNRLQESYQRFRELAERVRREQDNAKLRLAMLFSIPVKDNPTADAYDPRFRDELREETGILLALNPADLDLSRFSLWRVIREIVRQTTEMRVYELEAHLKGFGLKIGRSAVESALATHTKEFRITKRGREKYVSLKGA